MYAIVAVSKDWGIGYKNKLLFSIPSDMKFFRETTKDSVVIMGRKTLESFPGKKPLKNRINIVLTNHMDYYAEDAIICHSVSDAVAIAGRQNKKIFVIGGSMIYKELLPYCDEIYVTKVDADATADSFFPNLDELPEWKLIKSSETLSDNGFEFKFTTYKKDMSY